MTFVVKNIDGKHAVVELEKADKPALASYTSFRRAKAYAWQANAAVEKELPIPDPIPDVTAALAEKVLPNGEKWIEELRQADVDYQIISPKFNDLIMCRNCRWFEDGYNYDGHGGSDHCHLVQEWPKKINPLGWCERHENIPEPEVWEPSPQPVYIVDEPATLSAKAKLLIRSFLGKKAQDNQHRGFKINKAGKWIAWWTNNAEDLQGELFAQKAIDEYLAAVKAGDWPMPELWYCHIPGTKHGEAVELDRIGNMVYAVGTFDDTPMAEKFKAYYQKAEGEQVSHGFYYDPDLLIDDVYYWFRTYEITALPDGWAANPFTAFSGGKSNMGQKLEKHQVDALKNLNFTDEEIAQIEAEGASRTQQIAASGKRQKDGITEQPAEPAPATPDPAPVAAVTAPVVAAPAAVDAAGAAAIAEQIKAALLPALQGMVSDAVKTEMGTIKDNVKTVLDLAPRASKSNQTVVTDEEGVKELDELIRYGEMGGVPGDGVSDDLMAKAFPFFSGNGQQG